MPTVECPGWKLLLALVLAGSSAAAMAEDKCRLQISNPKVDYGATTRAELLNRQVSPLLMALGKQSFTLSATCKTPTQMTLFFRGSAADASSYQLGGGGNFTLRLSSARLDGNVVGLGVVQAQGQLPQLRADSVALPPQAGVVPISNDVPIKGTTLLLQVEVDAKVSAVGSRVSDRTTFRGSGNFELLEN